jgi:1-phosphofructokinase
MAARLGADVSLWAPLGGETGQVLQNLLAVDGITLVPVPVHRSNGAYVHDRRNGRRVEIAQTPSPELRRHELDDLYDATLTSGLEADVTLLTGPRNEGVLPTSTYERLARDLRRNDRLVLADLSGDCLRAALRGGLDLLKVSDEELVQYGWVADRDLDQASAAARALHAEGAENVIISRGEQPALALLDGSLFEVKGPRFTPMDEHGAGDSMFAAVGVGR